MASICFHLANSNSSSGATIWMPALLTRMSSRPKVRSPSRAGVDLRLVGHVHRDADRMVRPAQFGGGGIGRARFKSAMATLAPSRT
jgi:hypothetical protein